MESEQIKRMTIAQLESEIIARQFTIKKKYDGVTGLCTVTLTSKDGDTVITDRNRSKNALWPAYRRALQLAFEQLTGPRV